MAHKAFSIKLHGGLTASADFPVFSETFLHMLVIQACARILHAFRLTQADRLMTECTAVTALGRDYATGANSHITYAENASEAKSTRLSEEHRKTRLRGSATLIP